MGTLFAPRILSIMPTWQCPASCASCGTFSHPHNTVRLPIEDILAAIDRAHLDGFSLVVFTGGEATLRRKDLLVAIRYASQKGLATRLVSNGWWATDDPAAEKMIDELKNAGLDEINFSTGDEHSRFVPLDTVIRAIRWSAEKNFCPMVMIEVRADSSVTKAKLIEHASYKSLGYLSEQVEFSESPWMPLDYNTVDSYPDGLVANTSNVDGRTGCDSIFGTHTLQANGTLGVCCGLGMQRIPELQMGKFDRQTTSLQQLQQEAELDVTKLLIRQIGPERLLARVAKFDSRINWENKYAHKCQACLRVFEDPQVKAAIENNEEVLTLELAASMVLDRIARHVVD